MAIMLICLRFGIKWPVSIQLLLISLDVNMSQILFFFFFLKYYKIGFVPFNIMGLEVRFFIV